MTRRESKRPEKNSGKQSREGKQGQKQQMSKPQTGGRIDETVEGSRAEGAAGEVGGPPERHRK